MFHYLLQDNKCTFFIQSLFINVCLFIFWEVRLYEIFPKDFIDDMYNTEADLDAARCNPVFCNHLFFYDHFE